MKYNWARYEENVQYLSIALPGGSGEYDNVVKARRRNLNIISCTIILSLLPGVDITNVNLINVTFEYSWVLFFVMGLLYIYLYARWYSVTEFRTNSENFKHNRIHRAKYYALMRELPLIVKNDIYEFNEFIKAETGVVITEIEKDFDRHCMISPGEISDIGLSFTFHPKLGNDISDDKQLCLKDFDPERHIKTPDYIKGFIWALFCHPLAFDLYTSRILLFSIMIVIYGDVIFW